ncbi:hypothetical protein [Agarivorans albus]|uniref:Uncharacterized protein n=1 Tax=Agarivorans albus MKT 106 TaxID=1331007 RepID=R9PU18_AGAAL|nr:hypothetical protein [Agarivorans albus]GAD03396.1 hypothetical protein AALB_3476 [Agarivorans albus MKT 106]
MRFLVIRKILLVLMVTLSANGYSGESLEKKAFELVNRKALESEGVTVLLLPQKEYGESDLSVDYLKSVEWLSLGVLTIGYVRSDLVEIEAISYSNKESMQRLFDARGNKYHFNTKRVLSRNLTFNSASISTLPYLFERDCDLVIDSVSTDRTRVFIVSGSIEIPARDYCLDIWPNIFAAGRTRIKLDESMKNDNADNGNVIIVDSK